MKITEKEFNIQTGETTFTEREETAQEQTFRLEHESKIASVQAEAEAKAATRQALLTRLGITEDEAKILLGGN
jgi:hypothetical protein